MTISEVLHNELNTLRAENASLKEQVAQLEEINSAAIVSYEEAVVDSNKYLDQLTTLQSKSAALVDALANAQSRMPCPMYEEALAAFKEHGGRPKDINWAVPVTRNPC